ncbi:MAG: hypothetical protein Q4A62_00315 [Eikenella sp.]|nr:hypothetical protein [Eikenella sp.]
MNGNVIWLSRDIQKMVLLALAQRYPRVITASVMFDLFPPLEDHVKMDDLVNNIMYLEEHGLLRRVDFHGEPVPFYNLMNAHNDFYVATVKGIDFIQKDGGLSAIFGVQTIKFHADTISDLKSLLMFKLEQANISEDDKNKITAKLSEYGDEAAKHLLTKLLDAGIEKLPALLGTLGIAGLFN